MLAVIGTHPVQYHAPVYRALQDRFDIPVTAIYGSDFSVAGYEDREFGTAFAWDTDLLSGYQQVFLSRIANGGAKNDAEVSARGLGGALRKIKPRAVLVLGYRPQFNLLGLLGAKLANYPILFRAETTDHARRRGMFKRIAREGLLRWCYGSSDRLLYIGRRSYQHYKGLRCAEEKLIFSPYCVDTTPFEIDEEARTRLRPIFRREAGLSDQAIVLLFSGKQSHRKGPDLILRAIKRMPTELRERIVVVFLGSGEMQNELQLLASTVPAVKTIFPGFQNQTALSRFYHAADLLILPSRHDETWGLVVNEALHHGLPCVVSAAVGCAPDLIESGRTGFVFYSGSVTSLARRLEQSFALLNREEVRQYCRQKVNAYGVDDAARGIAEAYRQVCVSRTR